MHTLKKTNEESCH